jgi:hypothetical protein
MSERAQPDLWTAAAIGMAAYLIANVVHEGVGHGGVCLLVGGQPLAISSAWLSWDEQAVGPWDRRLVAAGGTAANLLLGFLAYGVLRATPRLSGTARYFVWLLMMVNLLPGGGYLMVAPLAGFGDWKAFVAGLPHALAWKLGLTALGVALSLLALRLGVSTLEPLLPAEGPERRARARRICWLPYLAIGGGVFTLASLFNPGGPIFMLTSALAHLGGSAWLAWLPEWVPVQASAGPVERLDLPRQRGWLAVGAVAFVITVLVLGPGVTF